MQFRGQPDWLYGGERGWVNKREGGDKERERGGDNYFICLLPYFCLYELKNKDDDN